MALGAPESLVYEACAEPYRDTQVGLELEAAMVHESRDDEVRRTDASFANASRLAASAAHLDPKFAAFAAAQSYWGEHASDPGALNDPQLEAAIEVVSQVCTDVGVPNGNAFVRPTDELSADTAERGHFDACEDMVFGDDGSVYVEGERFTYADCDRATEPALAEANHDDAYRVAVALLLEETGGFVCWGRSAGTSQTSRPTDPERRSRPLATLAL
jgi:hypothetical protein